MSSKTQVVSFRLSNEAMAKIEKAILSSRNGDVSVGDYCKNVIERHAFRHGKRKYKRRA